MNKRENLVFLLIFLLVLAAAIYLNLKTIFPDQGVRPNRPAESLDQAATSSVQTSDVPKQSINDEQVQAPNPAAEARHSRMLAMIPKPVSPRMDIDNSHYSFEPYPFASSTLFDYALQCAHDADPRQSIDYYKTYLKSSGLQDFRLVGPDDAVVIPSLRAYALDDNSECVGHSMFVFSKPPGSSNIYLWAYDVFESDKFNPGLYKIFGLDLSDLSVKPLALSETLLQDNRMGDQASSTMKLLPDGYRIIKWNPRFIWYVNLYADSSRAIYDTLDSNEWLVSSLNANMNSNGATYDIRFTPDSIIVGHYRNDISASGTPISIDQYGNVNWPDNTGVIKGKFTRDVVLPIPKSLI